MDVSENSGTPKSSILIGFSIIFIIHFGVSLFLETPIWILWMGWETNGSSCGGRVVFYTKRRTNLATPRTKMARPSTLEGGQPWWPAGRGMAPRVGFS